jgi:hypothetical protein
MTNQSENQLPQFLAQGINTDTDADAGKTAL